MRTLIVIPARFASSRLPGKPLIDIAGTPMVLRVWQQCLKVRSADAVVIATDDDRILQVAQQAGANAVMTAVDASCGTDRLAEIARLPQYQDFTHFVNVQGDEPLIRPEDIEKLIELLQAHPTADVATLWHAISREEADQPSSVKVVTGAGGRCLYFSRSRIPFDRDGESTDFRKHVGIYGYSRKTLEVWPSLTHGVLERRESLEQLRLLEAGLTLYAAQVDPIGPGVDTPETLEQVRALIEGRAVAPAPHPLADIRLVVTDVDGVLTDSRLHYDGENPSPGKAYNVRDGLGTSMLQAAGVPVAVLSGRADTSVVHRLDALKIPQELRLLGRHDKRAALNSLMAQLGLTARQVVYIGDDIIDAPAFEQVDHRAAPADAHHSALALATIKLSCAGGKGAFRELAELVLRAKGLEQACSAGTGFENLMKVPGSARQ